MLGAIRDDIVELLVERGEVARISGGEYFFRQGDGGSSAFLLESGEVEVLKSWQGEEHLLHRLPAGNCFGEVALLDFGKRSASIRATRDCSALMISARDLQQVARLDAAQFALIYMNLGRELSRRLRAADERVFRLRFEASTKVDGYTYAAM
jgi:CRP-like cAMP-binding protein